MQPGRNTQFVADLGRILAGKVVPPSDRALLDRFVHDRDEAAFEALVVRHGPMVRGVCHRLLAGSPDVDDAFQATFLVLWLRSRRIGDADRLAPWLFGVATRVALKARARAARQRVRVGVAIDDTAVAPTPNHDLLDVMPLIDAEITRLPAKLQEVVVLCLVEGTTPADAARRLGCPVGTVQSRLARGRAALRARLRRRGVTPAVALTALDLVAPAPISPALVQATLTATLARTLAPTLIALTRGVAPAMITKSTAIAALLLGGIALAGPGLATTWLKSSARAQGLVSTSQPEPQAAPPARSPLARSAVLSQPADQAQIPPAAAKPDTQPAPADRPLAARLAAILAEYETRQAAVQVAQERAATKLEQRNIYRTMAPDDLAYSRRLLELALEQPTDPAARDACIWVVDKPGRADSGMFGDEFARAAALLVRHHGDDPVAVAVGLVLNNSVSAHRDALLFGFLAAAKGREAQGMARLALARYLEHKTMFVRSARKCSQRRKLTHHNVIGDDGKPHDVPVDQHDEEYAYEISLRFSDPVAIQAEAERLYNEVISDYGDVPYVTRVSAHFGVDGTSL